MGPVKDSTIFFFQFSLFFNVFLGFLHIIIDLPSESPSEPSFDVRWLGIPTAEGEGLRPAALGALLGFSYLFISLSM